MRKLLSVIILILFSNLLYSYPVIITEQGVNHTEVKQLVYSIPEKYYKFIDVIEFRPYYAYCRVYDELGQKKCYDGWYWVYWDNKYHYCFNGKIILNSISKYTNKYILIHELCHIVEHCLLKKNYSTEIFADICELDKFEWS